MVLLAWRLLASCLVVVVVPLPGRPVARVRRVVATIHPSEVADVGVQVVEAGSPGAGPRYKGPQVQTLQGKLHTVVHLAARVLVEHKPLQVDHEGVGGAPDRERLASPLVSAARRAKPGVLLVQRLALAERPEAVIEGECPPAPRGPQLPHGGVVHNRQGGAAMLCLRSRLQGRGLVGGSAQRQAVPRLQAHLPRTCHLAPRAAARTPRAPAPRRVHQAQPVARTWGQVGAGRRIQVSSLAVAGHPKQRGEPPGGAALLAEQQGHRHRP
uniref:Putative secreted protein n=1 Tax=Ixodes ricinus TaxID=34613 RepID=A0A6B0V628_IXORI